MKDMYPGLWELGDRAIDCLTLRGVKVPEATLRFVQTSQSVDRKHQASGSMEGPSQAPVGCLAGNTRPYITTRCRRAHGKELLRMQGIYYPGHDNDIDDVPMHLLADLAGNAFHSGCCAAAKLSLLVAIARGYARAQRAGAGSSGQSSEQLGKLLDELW